ncbi:4-hydroxy-3-methylbut-2-en-1-yl diphosphate synthase (flavodoxin) [Bacteroidia bacterium]|nr:4-hydroxy-3-methylbut-2-en-1-yl diphosphate synthase (flavodoxin) [Bacteroidia bacterium]GHV70765.1 4-hydroxy-3-methylbut-2-en-1-yl diphosphate synthase (flavodoxin) [Bacteroidia bacterium]
MGGENPIRVQSMTNTSTLDTEGSIRQCIRIIEAGGEYVRLTAQGVREAENLRNIKAGLRELGYQTPLVADIHFNPQAAYSAAGIVEKVRINPGNFSDPVKIFKTFEYSDEEYKQEIDKIRERFIPFLNICKEHHTAIRIGVNHGSLSDRIMSRYGDTPEGMVESCMEFLRICVSENFTNVVISIKASSTLVMVATVRLLVRRMEKEEMKFPLHLGVTEAGDGEDGRIKSAVGIGTLLLEGIGDTIRVSLSEDPEAEIPVARKLLDYIEKKSVIAANKSFIAGLTNQAPIVISDYSHATACEIHPDLTPDFLYLGANTDFKFGENQKVIVDFSSFSSRKNEFPLFSAQEKAAWLSCDSSLQFLALDEALLDAGFIDTLKQKPQTVILLSDNSANRPNGQKAFIYRLIEEGVKNPVIIRQTYEEQDLESFQIKASVDCGGFFLDRLADGIFLQNTGTALSPAEINSCSFGILQATGRRISKTEYISCPSCGRTLFDLQATLKKVKAATAHLKGLKIGVMGCIVNGPGEMADADYGYVGAGAGKISLYKGKECIKKNIPEAKAVDELLQLIATFGHNPPLKI